MSAFWLAKVGASPSSGGPAQAIAAHSARASTYLIEEAVDRLGKYLCPEQTKEKALRANVAQGSGLVHNGSTVAGSGR